MAQITAFDWDNLYITPDEDPAYAGDKEPNSQDDIPCGEHYIPSDKTCHDGDAHDPEPGENPYWTDENSAEKRNERGVDWDDNKPSEPAPEEPNASEELIESVPEGQWARQKDMIAKALDSLKAVLVQGPQGNAKELGLGEAAKGLHSDDRSENLKAVEYLQNAVNEARDLVDAVEQPREERPEGMDPEEWYQEQMGREPTEKEYHAKRIDKAQFAVDVFNSSIEADDPRDIQVWDKIRRRPETLEVEDLLQLSGTEDPRVIRRMDQTLSEWRESPTLGGARLASMFMDSDSSIKPNAKLAMAILDRSARVGDEASNKMLWESFGLSEEWTPTSYLHDHRKAAEKGAREMKQFADWSGIEAAQQEYMLAGSDLAEAEFAKEEFWEEYQTRKEAILAYRDGDSYDRQNPEHKARYLQAISDLEDDKDASDKVAKDADWAVRLASDKILKEAEKIRQPMKDAMRKLNQYTQIDSESAGDILTRAASATWADIDDNDEDYRPGSGKGIAGQSGTKLKALRWKHRDQKNYDAMAESSSYPNIAKIQESLQDLFSIAHRDVVGGPGLRGISWESEVMVRAHANQFKSTITLSVGADLKKVPKHKMYDDTRKNAEGSHSDRDDIAIHEFAHHMEFSNPDVAERFAAFYERRTAGQPIVTKKDIDPRTGKIYEDLQQYDDDERFIPDHFFTIYCGRNYGEGSMGELVSMGVQAFYNKHMWGNMVRDDPEHMALIVATLRGY